MNRSRSDAATAGLVYSTSRGVPVAGRCWRFWYLQRSKRVWFRLPRGGEGRPLMFRYDGRPILHRSEVGDWTARGGPPGRPVVWGDRPALGSGAGPCGTNLYLSIWTRWSWLHPEACGSPERFSVEVLDRGTPGSGDTARAATGRMGA